MHSSDPAPPTDPEWDDLIAEARQHPKAYTPRPSQRFRRWWDLTIRRKARPLGKHVLPPRVVKETTAHQWARRRNPAGLRTVAPPSVCELPQAEFLIPAPIFDNAYWKRSTYPLPPLFTLEIPYGRTIGARGAIITPDHVLLSDLSRHFSPIHPILHTGLLPPAKFLPGRYAALSGPGNSTYHWLFDITTRFGVLQAAGYSLSDFDGFLLRRPKYPAHYKMLERLGIPEEKIIWCSGVKHFEAELLVVPSFTNSHLAAHHPFAYRYLRELLPSPPSGERKRFYLSRKDAPRASRRVANENEVEALLRNYGCEAITLSHLSLVEQAQLFGSAELIVAPHGGGLANLCFTEAPASVIEFFAPDYTPEYFRTISLQKGFRYEALAGEPAGSGDSLGGDIRIDLGQLRTVMDAVAAR